MKALRRIDRGLARVEEVVLFALLLGLLALAVFQVVWRNVVQPFTQRPPLLWADEVLKHTTFILGLLGGVLATHWNKHIALDVLARTFTARPRLEAGVRALVRAFALGLSLIFARAGLEQVRLKEEAFESVLAPWKWQLAIPVLFGLIALHLLLHITYDVAAALGRDAGETT